MIKIIADPHAYRSIPNDALSLTSPQDYVAARIAIRRALDKGTALTVHVTHTLVLRWFDDLKAYADIHWEQVALEEDFRRIFGVDPGSLFSSEILMRLDLTTIMRPPHGMNIDPVAWILGQRIDQVWAYPQGSPEHLTQLLIWAINHKYSFPDHLHMLAQHQISIWANDLAAYATLQVGTIVLNARRLVQRWALQNYDRKWLSEQGLADVPLIKLTLDAGIYVAVLNELAPAIERYWRQRIAGQSIDTSFLRSAVEQMSGWSEAELRTIEALVRLAPVLIDQNLLTALRQRFTGIPGSALIFADLEALVPPPEPEIPHPAWDDHHWLHWATTKYMPYFLWAIRADQAREHQQHCVRAYEDWLVQRYPHWLNSQDSPLLLRQFTLMCDIIKASSSAIVVWLVADGMTWWQGRMFLEMCRVEGLHAQRYETSVSLIPSLTTISKRALVTGVAPTTEPRGTIAQAAREQLERLGISNHVSYNDGELEKALRSPTPPRCLIWFANTLDQLAHDRVGVADDGSIRGYLEGLARGLARMRSICTDRGLTFHGLIGSDHGSTFLPASAPTRRLPHSTREVIDIWEDSGDLRAAKSASARAAIVSQGHSLAPEQLADWYFLERQAYELPYDYLVPRGYAAVNRRPIGWTHGGLTPEETIIPLMHLTSEPLLVEPLTLLITGQVRSQQTTTLHLQIINANPAPFDGALIRVNDISTITIDQILAYGRFETTIALNPRPLTGSELLLNWELHGSILGVEHHQQGEVRLPIRRLQTEDRFDDLFG